MGDLERDTRLEGEAGLYRAPLSRAWEGAPRTPIGGFLAALALRAAGQATPLARPVSFACQFARRPRFAPVDLAVSTLCESERTAALRVSITQSEAPILEALVWAVAEELPGYAVEFAAMPEHPGPEGLPSVLAAAHEQGRLCAPFWRHAEFRARWREPGEAGAPRDPVARAWHRFVPQMTYDDPFVDAARILILAEVSALSPLLFHQACCVSELAYPAATVDLTVQLHRDSRKADWLLVDGRVPAASAGIVHSQLGIWARDGGLVASAASTLVCRESRARQTRAS